MKNILFIITVFIGFVIISCTPPENDLEPISVNSTDQMTVDEIGLCDKSFNLQGNGFVTTLTFTCDTMHMLIALDNVSNPVMESFSLNPKHDVLENGTYHLGLRYFSHDSYMNGGLRIFYTPDIECDVFQYDFEWQNNVPDEGINTSGIMEQYENYFNGCHQSL